MDFRHTPVTTDVKKFCKAEPEDCRTEKGQKQRDENHHPSYANQEFQFKWV